MVTFNASSGSILTSTDVSNQLSTSNIIGTFTAEIGSNVATIANSAFKDTNVSSITMLNTVTSIEASAFENTYNLGSCTLSEHASFTELPNKCFFNSGIKTINIPANITHIRDNVFSADKEIHNTYQYIFIEPAGNFFRIDLSEIKIYDRDNVLISENGNYTFDPNDRSCIAPTAEFFYSESQDAVPSTSYHPKHIVGNNASTTDSSTTNGVVGYTSKRAYQRNVFERYIESNGKTTSYKGFCVIKFNEPKTIGKIEIHARNFAYYNLEQSTSESYGTSYHNIYLVNEDSVSIATMPSGYANQAYVTATIPYISGSNYTAIVHRRAEHFVTWNNYLKTYYLSQTNPSSNIEIHNYSNASGVIPMSNLTTCTFSNGSGLQYIGENSFNNTRLTTITIPNSVTTINNSAFSCTHLTNIDLPSSITILGDYIFANCLKLVTAKIHRYTNDAYSNSNNQITVGKNIFNNSNSSLEVEIISGNCWVTFEESIRKQHYRYVFYERYGQDNGDANAAMAQFEVYNDQNVKVSHLTSQNVEVLWSSRWDGYNPDKVISGTLSNISSEYWHSDCDLQNYPSDIFGTENTYNQRAHIGLDLKSPQDINQVILFASANSGHADDLAGGKDTNGIPEGVSVSRDGYFLYFTNNIVQRPNNENFVLTETRTPNIRTLIDLGMPYHEIGSWDAVYTDTTYDTFNHNSISFPLYNINFKYNIISGVSSIAADDFKNNVNLKSIILPSSLTTIGESGFYNTNLTTVSIPDSVSSIGKDAFSGSLTMQKYQYIFFECVSGTATAWLGIDEIEIWDIEGNKISRNGNWDYSTETGEMSTPDGDYFYYTDSYSNKQDDEWLPSRMVNRRIGKGQADEKTNFGIVGISNNYSYIKNLFTSTTNQYNASDSDGRIPYVAFKFSKPKTIGKIVVHSMRRDAYNDESSGSTSNHNIYLANEEDVTMATMPSGFGAWNHTQPEIPYISGSKYSSIFHSDSGVSWNSTHPLSYEAHNTWDKTYDFTTTPLAFRLNSSIKYPLESIIITGSSNLQTIGEGCLQNTKISSITLPNSLTTIGKSAFKKTNLTTISLPNSIQSIDDYAFASTQLSTADIHCNTGDNIANPITIGNEIFGFDNLGGTFELTVDSDRNLNNVLLKHKYQYVFYSRDHTNSTFSNSCIAEFEVWDNNDNRISHTLTPTIIWSSKWENTGGIYQPESINDGQVTTNHNNEWHSRVQYQSVYNIFGETETDGLLYKNAFIGYNFGTPQNIKKIVLSACGSSDWGVSHAVSLSGSAAHRIGKINGYKLYFTNNVHTVNHDNSIVAHNSYYAPSSYICVDPNEPYVVIDSYNHGTYVNATNDTYTHDNLSSSITTDYNIIDGTTTIPSNEFKDDEYLKTITIADSVTSLGDNIFEGTTSMTSCTLPINNNFTTIPQLCFKSSGLPSITIPDSIQTIENNAFYNCQNLTSCTLPINSNFTSIPAGCFYSSGLTSITIPNNVTMIDEYAFKNANLTSITIPDSVTTIGNWAFENNPLTSFTLPNNPSFTSIPQGCFFGSIFWTSIQTIPFQVTSIGNDAFTTDYNDHLNNNEVYLRLPKALKTHVDNPTSYTSIYDSRIIIEVDVLGLFKTNNNSVLVKYESSGSSNEIVFTSGYTINGAFLSNFRKGIINESLYNYTLLNNTLQSFYDIYPYAVAGDIGYIWSGCDIGKRICPYYKIYTSNVDINLIQGWTKLGIFAVGGGGGGGGGGWAYSGSSTWEGKRMGAGSGGSSGGVGFVLYDRQDLPNLSKLKIEVGAGGAGGENWTGNNYIDRCGRRGQLGGHSVVKDYDDQSNTPLMEAYRGGTGSGGWIGWDEGTATIGHIDGGEKGEGTNDYQQRYSPDYEAKDATVRGHDSAGNATAAYHGSAPTPDPGFECRTYGTKYTNVGNGNDGDGARDSGGSYPLTIASGQSGGSIQHNLNIIDTSYGAGGKGGNEGNQGGSEGGNNGTAGLVIIFYYFSL